MYALGGMGVTDDLASAEVFNTSTKVRTIQGQTTNLKGDPTLEEE